ncbi:MAG: glycosyl hydrolase family 8 [Myxococcota bacterium]
MFVTISRPSALLATLGSTSLLAALGCAPGDSTDLEPAEEIEQLGPCTLATNITDQQVEDAYAIWLEDIVTEEGAGGFRRTRRPDTPDGLPNSTVSEGVAYGMMMAVIMDDQPLFDDLWQYSQLWLDNHGLMMWYIDPTGTEACPGLDPELTCGAATDSDEDIAWALLMAEKKWGGQGSLDETYGVLARRQIETVFQWEVDHGWSVLKPGDGWGGYAQTNPSYFAPSYYRVFGEVTDNVEGWQAVIDTSYEIIENSLNEDNGNTDNGLVPAWCDFDGVPRPPTPNDPTQLPDDNWQYDSARIPFRIGQDWCYNEEPRAKAYLDKINAFYTSIGADDIVDGYALDGTPRPDERSDEPTKSAVFLGCAGVGAMADAENQEFIDRAAERVAGLDLTTRSRYYQRSWTAMSLMMMSGRMPNLADFANDEPSE